MDCFFCAQGGAVGLGYIALSGRKLPDFQKLAGELQTNYEHWLYVLIISCQFKRDACSIIYFTLTSEVLKSIVSSLFLIHVIKYIFVLYLLFQKNGEQNVPFRNCRNVPKLFSYLHYIVFI